MIQYALLVFAIACSVFIGWSIGGLGDGTRASLRAEKQRLLAWKKKITEERAIAREEAMLAREVAQLRTELGFTPPASSAE